MKSNAGKHKSLIGRAMTRTSEEYRETLRQVRELSETPATAGRPKPISKRQYAWCVTIGYLTSSVDPRIHHTCIYVRASDPPGAQFLAYSYWKKWERLEKGLKDWDKYPDSTDLEALCIDDNDFTKSWHEARKWPHRCVGDKEAPMAFTFYPKEELSIDRLI